MNAAMTPTSAPARRSHQAHQRGLRFENTFFGEENRAVDDGLVRNP